MIAISGMKMPKGCHVCPLSQWVNQWTFLTCDINGHRFTRRMDEYAIDGIRSTRPEWCPLIEIPEEEVNE